MENDTGNNSIVHTIRADVDHYIELYRSVVNAYIALGQSGYNLTYESILGDEVCLTQNGDGSYFIGNDSEPTFMYAFYDLNRNATPELLIEVEMKSA